MASIPALRKALMDAAYCGMTVSTVPNASDFITYQIRLDSGGKIGFSATVEPGGALLPLPLFERLPRISVDALTKKLGRDPFEGMDDVFAREIHRSIRALETASSLGSAVLFDRRVDETILKSASANVNESRQVATAGVLSLTVPFLKNVPPDRLLTLREQIPTSFLDFRARLHEVAKLALSGAGMSAEELRAKVEGEVSPHIAALEAELNSELLKARILKLGVPIISAAAVLAGAILSALLAPLLGLGATGVASALKGKAVAVSATELAKGKPFYFLWQAQNLSR